MPSSETATAIGWLDERLVQIARAVEDLMYAQHTANLIEWAKLAGGIEYVVGESTLYDEIKNRLGVNFR